MKLLANLRPELLPEWDASRNGKMTFDAVTAHSKIRVWWRCTMDKRHGWQAQVRDRTLGHGCPYCSGRYTLREESFGTLYPQLAKQLHPSKNLGFDPFATAPLSNKKVFWVCSKHPDHVWESRLSGRTESDAGCPICRQTASSLANAAPELAKEWHPKKNLPHTPETTSTGSRLKAWWQCKTNPQHVWDAQVRMRVDAKTGCPVCARSQPQSSRPTLRAFSADLTKQWHPTRNGGLTPDDVTVGSHRSVWWKCEVAPDHEWSAPVRNRARLGHGCPMCSTRTGRASRGSNLADKHPKLAAQWHAEKNGTLRPENVTPGSTKRVWWKCFGDPPHIWDASIYNRTSRQPEGECAFCAKTRLTDCNSLLTVHPDLAAEWHPTKNGSLTAADVSRASGKKVWWRCGKEPSHEWIAMVKNRTIHKSGCPGCEAAQRAERLQIGLLESVQLNVDCQKTLLHNLDSLRAFVKQGRMKTVHMTQALYRMVYSSAITALETFLSDSFYQNVVPSQTRMEKLLSTAPEFADRKYSIAEVVNWSQNVKKKVSEYLYDIVWHNLSKVKMMYSAVLGIEFPSDMASLHRAVSIRHDLVHRNGRTKDNRLHTFKPDELLKLFASIEDFAAQIQLRLDQIGAES